MLEWRGFCAIHKCRVFGVNKSRNLYMWKIDEGQILIIPATLTDGRRKKLPMINF
jgi:hypothetical protein